MDLVSVNLWAVLLCGIAAMAIGFLWYSPILFGKIWMELSGINPALIDAAKKKGMVASYIANFVASLLMAYVLAHVLSYVRAISLGEAISTALWMWLGFVATISLGNVLWEQKPFKLWILNNSYNLLNLIVMSIILFYLA